MEKYVEEKTQISRCQKKKQYDFRCRNPRRRRHGVVHVFSFSTTRSLAKTRILSLSRNQNESPQWFRLSHLLFTTCFYFFLSEGGKKKEGTSRLSVRPGPSP